MNGLNNIYSMSNAEIIMTFGKRLKDYRISMRLTQQELADVRREPCHASKVRKRTSDEHYNEQFYRDSTRGA